MARKAAPRVEVRVTRPPAKRNYNEAAHKLGDERLAVMYR